MKQIPSSRFRRSYLAESEPVQVMAHKRTVGFWYPYGTSELPEGAVADEPTVTEGDGVRFTIRPAQRPRPQLVAEVRHLLDPVELRKQERVRHDEFASRTFGRKQPV